MPKEDVIKELESTLGLESGSLSEAIDNDAEIKLPKGKFFTEENLDRYRSNLKEEFSNLSEESRKSAEQAGFEIALKRVKEIADVDFEGRKDPEKLLAALEKKYTQLAGVEPEQKLKEALNDNEKLRVAVDQLTSEKEEANKKLEDVILGFQKKENEKLMSDMIMSAIPDEGLVISKTDVMGLFNSTYDKELVEGKIIYKSKNGDIIKNDIADPLTTEEIVSQFSSKYIKKPEGGRGGSDSGSAAKKDLDSFRKEMAEKGIGMGEEMNKIMNQRLKDGSLII